MNRGLTITLIIACIVTALFVFKKIKKSQFKIGDTVYWLVFCLFLLAMSIFPNAIYHISEFIGFESSSNFVFVTIIFLLLVKIFLLDARLAKTEDKLTKLVQKYAIDNEKNKNE